jgi:hypothetical protein
VNLKTLGESTASVVDFLKNLKREKELVMKRIVSNKAEIKSRLQLTYSDKIMRMNIEFAKKNPDFIDQGMVDQIIAGIDTEGQSSKTIASTLKTNSHRIALRIPKNARINKAAHYKGVSSSKFSAASARSICKNYTATSNTELSSLPFSNLNYAHRLGARNQTEAYSFFKENRLSQEEFGEECGSTQKEPNPKVSRVRSAKNVFVTRLISNGLCSKKLIAAVEDWSKYQATKKLKTGLFTMPLISG